ncbi:hypothetical protein KAU11_10530 [Candidatus Babeliales bacterium]|nr:hypothetical protein [Candidatus Babeliales bacterium]
MSRTFKEVLERKEFIEQNTSLETWKLLGKMVQIKKNKKGGIEVTYREKEIIKKEAGDFEMYITKFRGFLRTSNELLMILNIFERGIEG